VLNSMKIGKKLILLSSIALVLVTNHLKQWKMELKELK